MVNQGVVFRLGVIIFDAQLGWSSNCLPGFLNRQMLPPVECYLLLYFSVESEAFAGGREWSLAASGNVPWIFRSPQSLANQ